MEYLPSHSVVSNAMRGGTLDFKEDFGLFFCFHLGQPVKGRPSDSEMRTSVPGHSHGAGFQ